MNSDSEPALLALNAGSSTIKFALYRPVDPPEPLLRGNIDRTGSGNPVLQTTDPGTGTKERISLDPELALADALIGWLGSAGWLDRVKAIGQRVVFGMHIKEHQRVTPELIGALKGMIEFNPNHLPGQIALIEAIDRSYPELPQVACFDTAFHSTLPPVAKLLPIPRKYRDAGVERYGYHGLSYEYLVDEIKRRHGQEAAKERIILAHLGNGASMTAIRDGISVDTSMGFTPYSGLPMSTRPGDFDAGVAVYLMQSGKLTLQQFNDVISRECGLYAISGFSADVRDLLDRQAADPRAAEAIEYFCYQTRKWIGAYAAVLGGLDRLVFAGGIGENAAAIRAGICRGLEFLGIELDEAANAAHGPAISRHSGRVAVEVIRTNEELMIAKLVMKVTGISAPARTGS